MRRWQQFGFVLMVLLVSAVGARAQAVVVDQLAATVNGEAITQSEILWGLALDPKVVQVTDDPQNWMQMLNQFIDQRLLLEEAGRLPSLDPTPEEITQAIGDLIRRFSSEAAFRERIGRVGLTAEKLRDIIRQRLQILKYIDFRFRSFAIITEAEIQRYYREVLKSKLQSQGINQAEQPTDKERNLIESILIEERVNREIDRFLENARGHADIAVLARF